MTKKKPSPDNPVTLEAADAFALFVRRWQHSLNLNDWRIERSSKAAGKANLAEVVKRSLPDRLATWRVGADFGAMHVNETTLEQIACHEVLHIFLTELMEHCRANASEEDIASAEHRVVNTLVSILVPER
jgi:hypothetical protein